MTASCWSPPTRWRSSRSPGSEGSPVDHDGAADPLAVGEGETVGLGHPVAVDHLIQPRTTTVERMPVHRFVHDAN